MTNRITRQSPGKERREAVRAMFSRIASRYTMANSWMTWGQDIKWRREAFQLAQVPEGGSLLDIGTGTGDLALQAAQSDKIIHTIGADFSPEMISMGRGRQGGGQVSWLNTDALELPFGAETFDAVISGYLLRNVIDINNALAEQYRVLKGGGRIVSLDTSPPQNDFWHFPVQIYLKYFIPLIGWLIAGDRKAYTYLPDSTQNFLQAEELKIRMVEVGFREVGFKRFMGGAMAIHWGIK